MSITLAQYAAAKCLPVAFLRDIGVNDVVLRGHAAIEIPYPGAKAVRIRKAIEKSDLDRRFEWKADSEPTFYGIGRPNAGNLLLVEGESDCHTCWHAGIPALGVPGASSFEGALRRAPRAFDGIDTVYVVNERDGGGKTLLESLRKSPIAGRIKIVDLAPHKDPSEVWIKLASGVRMDQAVAEFQEVMGEAMGRAGPLVEPRQESNDSPEGTEAAIAEYLAGTNLNMRLRWRDTTPDAGWWLWTGTHWQASGNKLPLPLQVAVRRALASGLEGRRIDVRGLPRLESAAAMRGIASMLSAFPSMLLANEVDPPGLIATPAGVLDLASGETVPHDPARSITRCCPVDPATSGAVWPLIEAHLRDCLGSLYPAVHRFLGSALIGLGADRRLLWLHGPGGDGKSTLAKILRAALGDHAGIIPAEVFAADGGRGAHQHELAAGMAGIRLAIGLEVSPHLDWPKVKGLSGGDEQRTKHLHGRAFTYGRPPVLVLVSNDAPTPPDRACAERLIVAGLQPPADPDERIMAALKTPGPERDLLAGACLAWLLAGCADFQANGGLGPVPIHGHTPTGLVAWWQDAVGTGRIVPGQGWATLAAIRDDLAAYDAGMQHLHDRELAAFLRTVVSVHRFKDARRYALMVTHGDASEASPSHAYRETVSMRHHASPAGDGGVP